ERCRHSWSARARTRFRHSRSSRSRIPNSREIANQPEELLPLLPLRGEDFTSGGGDLVVAAAPLPRPLDPASLNQLPLFELVEGGVERGEVERQRAARPLFDELCQLVAVTRFFVEEGEDDELGGAFLRFADRAGELHGARLYSGVQNMSTSG